MSGAIEFIQYLRPDGKMRTIWINRPDRIAKMADEIRRRGLRLECEVLTTQECRFIVANNVEDLDEEICPNDDRVPGTVDKLIERFYNTLTRVKKQE